MTLEATTIVGSLSYVTNIATYTGDRHPYVGEPAVPTLAVISQFNQPGLIVPAADITAVTIQT